MEDPDKGKVGGDQMVRAGVRVYLEGKVRGGEGGEREDET